MSPQLPPTRGLSFRFAFLVAAILFIGSALPGAAQQQELPERSPVSLPPAPTLLPHKTLTNELTLALNGETIDGVSIEVASPTGTRRASVYPLASADNPEGEAIAAFRTQVDLRANSVNHVLFAAITSTGVRSAPTTTSIIHDEEPPNIFIDFPKPGDVIATDRVDVLGRVGDRLSGSQGLTVFVRGSDGQLVEAVVDIGVGANGTFIAEQIPINPGATTTIRAFAADKLLNQATASVDVSQEDPVGAQMLEVSGNRQQGFVGAPLPDSLRIQVLNTDESIFPGKTVTFTVTRSDGSLRLDPNDINRDTTLQVETDANGIAEVYWTLGSDSGCGNNRVTATSMSITAPVSFCASAQAASATQIKIGDGNYQIAEVGTVAPLPLDVWVSDGSNGVAGVPVTFVVTEGGGLVNDSSVTTIPSDATGHAKVRLTLGPDPGNNTVEAIFSGIQGSPAILIAQGRARNANTPTSFSGVVLDNSERPIVNATCVLVHGEEELTKQSGTDGRFKFDAIPFAGMSHLHIDGSTASFQRRGRGSATYPSLAYEVVLIPNARNSLPLPVRLPPLTSQPVLYDGRRTAILRADGLDGLELIVRAGTQVTKTDGSIVDPNNPIMLSLNQVHHDDLPMPMPDGVAPPFAGTVQPSGTLFDPPIEIVYPNVAGLPPGSISSFLSFDHDIGRFIIVGTGMVVEDGSVIRSDPGSGIDKAGWWGNRGPFSIGGVAEGDGDDMDDRDDDDCDENDGVRLSLSPSGPFTISADEPNVYFVASVSKSDPNDPNLITRINGAEIEWRFIVGNGSLSTQTSQTVNGKAVIQATVPSLAYRAFAVEARLLTVPACGKQTESSQRKRSGTFVVQPGQPANVTINRSKDIYTADGTDTVEFEAIIQDGFGNLVANGTTLKWLVTDSTSGFVSTENETLNGRAKAVLRSPQSCDPQNVEVDLGPVEEFDTMPVQRAGGALTASQSVLDISAGAITTIISPVLAADNTPVFWTTSNGTISQDSFVSNGFIQNTLSTSEGRLGIVIVTATIGGEQYLSWQGEFIASTGIAAGAEFPTIVGDATENGEETVVWPNGTVRQIPYIAETKMNVSGPPNTFVRLTLPDAPISEAFVFDSQTNQQVTGQIASTQLSLNGAEISTTKSHMGAGSMFLDGSDTPLVPNHPAFQFTTELCAEVWVCPEPGGGVVFGKGNAWQVSQLPDSRVQGTINTSNGPFSVVSSLPLPTSTWTQVSLQYDGSTVKIHTGSNVASLPASGTLVTNGAPVAFGIGFQGYLDDFSLRSSLGSFNVIRLEEIDAAGRIALDENGLGSCLACSRGQLAPGLGEQMASVDFRLVSPGTSPRGGYFTRLWLNTKIAAVSITDSTAIFFGLQDPRNGLETVLTVSGGIAAVGDFGAIVKNFWRAVGRSPKKVNLPEVTLSGIGVLTSIASLTGVGLIPEVAVSTLRGLSALLGDTPFVRVLITRLRKFIQNAEVPSDAEIDLYQRLVSDETLANITNSLIRSDQAYESLLRVGERYGNDFLEATLTRLGGFSNNVVKQTFDLLDGFEDEIAQALLQNADLAANAQRGLARAITNGIPADTLRRAVRNPGNYFRSGGVPITYSPLQFLDELDVVADSPGLALVLEDMAKWDNPGALAEFRVGVLFRRMGHMVEFTRLLKDNIDGSALTDLDVVANVGGIEVFVQVKSGGDKVKKITDWVEKAKTATPQGQVPTIRYYVDKNRIYKRGVEEVWTRLIQKGAIDFQLVRVNLN